MKIERGLVIMRPTEDCNLGCRYCYSTKSSELVLMDDRTLERTLRKILDFYGHVTFVWHGGESTMAGLDFFKRAMSFQDKYKKPGQKIINEIQTNGTLIDANWVKFFRERNFFVGVSVDGPKEINDVARINQDGSGAFDSIFRGIQLMKRGGINVAGICVLAKHNINHINEIISFYEEQGMPLNINPFISSGKGSIFRDELLISPGDFSRAMIDLFDRWFEDPAVKIYDFYKIVKSFFTGSNNICCYSGKCSSEYISVCPNGDVYPCGRWAGEKTFFMGNLNKDSMRKIVTSRAATDILNRREFLDDCKDCQWLEICNGGCPHTSYLYTGNIYNRDFYCKGRKKLFSHIYKKVSSSLEEARRATKTKQAGG